MELKSANTEYSVQLEQLTQQLDVLTSRKQQLEDEMALSAVKREAAQLYEQVLYCTVLYYLYCTVLYYTVLYEQLAEAESKRDKLAEEARQRGTPAQVSHPSYPPDVEGSTSGGFPEAQSADYGRIQTSLALLDSHNSARRL